MTPFIMWLSKGEVDELLSTLVNKSSTKNIEDNLLNTDELLNFAQKLIEQNSKLIKIIEKIEPLNPMNKKAVDIHGIEQKCKHFHNELNNMSLHCSVYNNSITRKYEEFMEIICNECSRKTSSCFSKN